MMQAYYIVTLSFVIAFPIGVLGGILLMNWANKVNDEAYELKKQKIINIKGDRD